MLRKVFLVGFLVVSSTARGDETEDKTKKYLELWKAREIRLAQEAIDKNANDVRLALRDTSKAGKAKVIELRQAGAGYKARLAEMKKYRPAVGELVFQVGYVGRITGANLPVQVRSVIDKSSVLAVTSGGNVPFYVRGLDFSTFVDGELFRPAGIFAVTGTDSYVTANGAKHTALVIEPFDVDKALAEIEAKESEDAKAAAARAKK
jgi:hypothetical protein